MLFDWVLTVLTFAASGVLATTLVLFVVGLVAVPRIPVTAAMVWALMNSRRGRFEEGKVPGDSLVQIDWLRDVVWIGRELERLDRTSGSRFALDQAKWSRWVLIATAPLAIAGVAILAWGPGLLSFFWDPGRALSFSVVIGAALCGVAAHRWWGLREKLRADVTERGRSVVRHLPYTLDFLALVLDAGATIEGALEAYVDHGAPGHLRDEVIVALQEIRAGAAFEDAVTGLERRNPFPELMRLGLAVTQARRTGTPVADVLKAQSEVLRIERNQRATELAEEMTVDSRVWLSGIAVSVLLLFVGPFLLGMVPGLRTMFGPG